MDLLSKFRKYYWFNPAMRILQMIWKFARIALKVIFVLACIYAVVFSVTVSYGAWRIYDYGKSIVNEVKDLRHSQPESSAFMQAYRESNPELTIRHRFIPLDSISPHLVQAVIAAEDAAFRQHPGFDVRAILEAMDLNQSRGRTVFGGSTLTQQLAKNLFLSSERSWERKFKELAYAVLMEKYLGKDRILELYLNYAQWGKDIFGSAEACEAHFRRHCSRITLDQAVSMAAVLANPERFSPHSTNSQFMAKRRQVIYNNLFGARKLDSLSFDSLSATTREVIENADNPVPALENKSHQEIDSYVIENENTGSPAPAPVGN